MKRIEKMTATFLSLVMTLVLAGALAACGQPEQQTEGDADTGVVVLDAPKEGTVGGSTISSGAPAEPRIKPGMMLVDFVDPALGALMNDPATEGVTLTFVRLGENIENHEVTDPAMVERVLSALSQIQIGDEAAERTLDPGSEIIVHAPSGEYVIDFEEHNIAACGSSYALENSDELFAALDEIEATPAS